MVKICTYNARTLASESLIEELLMQARMISYDVIGLAETRRRHPLNAVYDTGEELFLGTCDSRGVGGVGVLVNTTPISNYDEEELEASYMDMETFCREDHAFFKVITGDFNAKIGPGRSSEERHIGTHGLEWNEQGERLPEFIMATKTIHGNSQFQKS
uniref:Endo/exonuclease/phosphatase domain-containing protein n=1 Tax=Angiostrongylus cantonensis TaxID=6313 RepID=A0A0K0DDV1_ANGCA